MAKAARQDEVTVDVVQIGGRTPEPIPEIDDTGKLRGWRKDSQGNPLTTSLSAEGEAQLAETAKSGGGFVVRSGSGSTGIDKMAHELARWMNSELSEKVETVYADVYAYPLILAILLLIAEVFIGQAPRHKKGTRNPEGSPSGGQIDTAATIRACRHCARHRVAARHHESDELSRRSQGSVHSTGTRSRTSVVGDRRGRRRR